MIYQLLFQNSLLFYLF